MKSRSQKIILAVFIVIELAVIGYLGTVLYYDTQSGRFWRMEPLDMTLHLAPMIIIMVFFIANICSSIETILYRTKEKKED